MVDQIYGHVDVHDPAFDAALRTVWGEVQVTAKSLLPRAGCPATGRDRLEILTALINARRSTRCSGRTSSRSRPLIPSTAGTAWSRAASDPRPGAGTYARRMRGDGVSARHGEMARAEFVRTASPAGPAAWIDERPCRICPGRPARSLALGLCDKHQFRWYRHLELRGDDADFDDWLARQWPYPGYGGCRVRVCPELANSPLGLCARHESRSGGVALLCSRRTVR